MFSGIRVMLRLYTYWNHRKTLEVYWSYVQV